MATVARFEITNFGKLIHFPSPTEGTEITIPRNKTIYTNDRELAEFAGAFKYIGVKENVPELSKMTKKELVNVALELGIKDTANKRKAQLRSEIKQIKE